MPLPRSQSRSKLKVVDSPGPGWASGALRLVLAGALAWTCQTAPAAVTTIAATNVGARSSSASVTVTMAASGTAAAPQAVTQGLAGWDFSIAAGGSCAAGVQYSAGQQCTVNVVFAPVAPGMRSGAVVVLSTSGTLLGSAPIAGTGTGALAVLNPGTIDTVAGDGQLNFLADGVAATQASIFLPYGVVVDPAGNIYLSDTNNNRVRRVDAQSGLISTVAGNGQSGYSGDGGPATQASLSQPAGLTMDGAGNLYFADSGNDIVRRIDAVSGMIATVAGVPLVQGYSGDGSAATAAELSSPRGVAFDAAGDLLIADTSNNAVREVSAATGKIVTVAGTGAAGYNGDGILATKAQLNWPWTVSVGADGSLYLADLSNNRVRKVTAGVISTIAGTGAQGFAGDGGPASVAELDDPTSAILDPAGDLYIADSGNNRVRKVYAGTGTIATLSGNDSEEFFGDGGPANQASLYAPYALSFDAGGDLLIADTLHNRIRRIGASPVALTYPVMRVGKTSAPQVLGLENDGNAGLSLSAPALSQAALDAGTTTCSFTAAIASSGTCNLGVEFAPTVVGTVVQGSVTLNSNAASAAVVNVSGQVLSVEPTTTALTSSVNPSLVGQAVTFTATVASDDPSRSGPVTFFDGATAICSNVSLSAGSATCASSALTLGQHSVTASYAGDDNNAASVSPALVQVVKQQPALVLTVSPNPANVTATVTLTLAASASSGTPSGTAMFFDGTTAISGNVSLSTSGGATFATAQLTPGQHSLSVQYAGDAADAAGQSNTVAEVVNQMATLTTVASNNANAVVGSAIALTANVSNANGPTPTGTVQFTDGTAVLGVATLDGSGHAVLAISTLIPGGHTIVASYGGDTDNAASASAGFVETIQQIATATALAADVNPASAGATIHLTATVTIAGGAAADGALGGSVVFSSAGVTLGTVQVSTAGTAVLAVSTLLPGLHSVVATYSGSTNYAGGASNALVESIATTATATVLTTGGGSALAGMVVTLTASVTSATGVPGGTVVFEDGGASIGQGTLNAQGVATVTTTSLAVGSHTLAATYQGNASYVASTSVAAIEAISLATPGVTLAGPTGPVNVGTAVLLTGAVTSNGVAPSGSATLRDGSAAIATQTVTNTGALAFSVATLAIGAHTLTVAYGGDANNAAATSNAIAVTVQQASSATTLTAGANPSVAGQALTLTAAVASAGGTVTGSVTFADGGTVLGSVPLGAGGGAVFTTSSLAFGGHTLTAVYAGDTNHAASTSPAIAEQIVEPASVTPASSVNPAVAGTMIALSAKVAGVGALVPAGTVSFFDGATALAKVQLDATGSASWQTSSLAVGSHAITMSYSGDANYAAAMSAVLVQTVESANTQVALTASANPATYGAALALTATIASNGVVATGSVSFTDGGTALGSAVLNASGIATLTSSSLAPGAHTIVASYAGDGRASASASTPLALSVKQTTNVVLASGANPAQTLSPVVLAAAVANGGATPVTGTVTFSDGGAQLGTAAVDASGNATLTVPQMTAGSHALGASYGGDGNDFASVAAAVAETVQLRATTTGLSSSASDPSNPQQVTLIGVVRWTGTATPTGTIAFASGNTVLGTSPVGASGVATMNLVLPVNGTENVTATYAGDASYAGSASGIVSVAGGAATQFSITLDPASVSVQSSQHTVVNLTVASVNSFADTLQFGCLGLPYAATCTFSSTQSALAANGMATVQLTIDTGDPLGAGAEAQSRSMHQSDALLCLLPGGVLAGFALFGRRRRSLAQLLPMACAAAALAVGMSGCAGLQVNGTPAGSYSFDVTAKGLGTGATESQPMALTVTP